MVRQDCIFERRRDRSAIAQRWRYDSAVRLVPLGILAMALLSCEGAVRDQTLLVIDTDMPMAGRSLPVATVDTLRIDIYGPGAVVPKETRELLVADPGVWPISLGIVGSARVRIRLFAARGASVEDAPGGGRVREPRAEVAVDRLVDVSPRGSGVQRGRVLLAGDCLGRGADPVAGRTCRDARGLDVPSAEGPDLDDGSPTRTGTWSGLVERPCASPDRADRPCVPGGFDVLGDVGLRGIDDAETDSVPLRPVIVSPFRMDRTEYTVGRLRSLLRAGYTLLQEPPSVAIPKHTSLAYCTYRGMASAAADALPLNCVTFALAAELCAADGGRLPTEAEWEHAASGRGLGLAYPWGTVDPTCCAVELSRSPRSSDDPRCPSADGPAPAGSHLLADCVAQDRSRDGIVDMGGSLFELTQDALAAVRDCTPPGIRVDPVCTIGDGRVIKSADWTAGLARARSAFRAQASGATSFVGFRCVYPEVER